VCDESRRNRDQWKCSCNRDQFGAVVMADERQERAEQELHTAADDFIGGLRLAQGMDEAAFDRLREAIIEIGSTWAAEDHLPKFVVNILLGMFSWIDSASYLYEGDEAAAIRRAARDVESLIFQHVVPAA
jgi:hypothetical protein